jgi:hypothetical protein
MIADICRLMKTVLLAQKALPRCFLIATTVNRVSSNHSRTFVFIRG